MNITTLNSLVHYVRMEQYTPLSRDIIPSSHEDLAIDNYTLMNPIADHAEQLEITPFLYDLSNMQL